jgi:anti-sigma regulatory factor (Ser/Thr protein kinase)
VSDGLRLTLDSTLAEVVRLGEAVEAFAERQQLSPEVAHAAALALEEVVVNCIRHGYGDRPGHVVEVELVVRPDELMMAVEDSAPAFDPLVAPPPDTVASLAERPVGGLGILLVRRLMDAVEYTRVGDRNRMVMRKRLSTVRDCGSE